MTGTLIFGIFSLIFCILFCIFRANKANVYSLILKIVASLCFILCGIFAVRGASPSGNLLSIDLLIICGLVCGLVGDIVLDLKVMYPQQNNQYFISGTSAFSLGHVFYFLATVFYNSEISPKTLPWNILASIGIALILTTVIMLSSKKMNMQFGKMFYVVAFYSLILTFMLSYSIAVAIFSPIFWIFAGGMIAFILSDLVLSMQYFGNRHEKVWIYVNHILYYLAQIAIAFSILYLVI